MGIRRGSISTPIIADGLVLNMDAANRASYVPNATQSLDTINNISGSLYNDTSFLSQPVSASCWTFDGTDDRIGWGAYTATAGPLNLDNLVDKTTFSVWAKIRNAGLILSGIYISSYLMFNTANRLIYVQYSDVPNASNSSLVLADTLSYINDGDWHNIVATQDGIVPKIYLNGNNLALAGSNNSISNGTATSPRSSLGLPVNTIGARSNAGNAFNGEIANVMIYNRTLSANEVLHNYNSLKSRFT